MGHTCLFQNGFCTDDFVSKEKNAVTLSHSEKIKIYIFGGYQGNVKDKEIANNK